MTMPTPTTTELSPAALFSPHIVYSLADGGGTALRHFEGSFSECREWINEQPDPLRFYLKLRETRLMLSDILNISI